MGDMVSLKRTDRGREESMPAEVEKPRYEWGTCLNLEGDLVTRMGLEGVNAGETVNLSGVGFIESVTVDDDERGKRTSVRLQLTDAAVERNPQVDQAQVLYGGGQ